jgi:hypothetical protein
MGAWMHPRLSSQRLETIRLWALRAAEQSREYGEPEPVWEGYLDTADRVSDLLDQRQCCGITGRFPGCGTLRLRATEGEREKRNGCFFPHCLLSLEPIRPGFVRFHFNK